jgi:hypothetical protein
VNCAGRSRLSQVALSCLTSASPSRLILVPPTTQTRQQSQFPSTYTHKICRPKILARSVPRSMPSFGAMCTNFTPKVTIQKHGAICQRSLLRKRSGPIRPTPTLTIPRRSGMITRRKLAMIRSSPSTSSMDHGDRRLSISVLTTRFFGKIRLQPSVVRFHT